MIEYLLSLSVVLFFILILLFVQYVAIQSIRKRIDHLEHQYSNVNDQLIDIRVSLQRMDQDHREERKDLYNRIMSGSLPEYQTYKNDDHKKRVSKTNNFLEANYKRIEREQDNL